MARRIRVRPADKTLPNIETNESDRRRLRKLLKTISENDATMAELVTSRKTMLAEVEKLMVAYGFKSYEYENVLAQRYRPKGNATTYINPQEFRDIVGPDEFFDAITVGITAARKLLNSRQFAELAQVTYAKLKDEIVEVKTIEVQKKRRIRA